MEITVWGSVIILIAAFIGVLVRGREYGADGHKHRWRCGYSGGGRECRTCTICGHREWQITG